MIRLRIVSFQTRYAKITPIKEGGHTGYDAIVSMLNVKANPLAGGWTSIYDSVEMFFWINQDLISGKHILYIVISLTLHCPLDTPACRWRSSASVFCRLHPWRIASHFSCLSMLAFAVTMALAQHSSYLLLIWMMHCFSFRNRSRLT